MELVWDDTVAPETCIDLDAPHVSTQEVLAMFFGAFAFFGSLYGLVYLSDPVSSNPVATRANVIPHSLLRKELGLPVKEEEGDGDADDE